MTVLGRRNATRPRICDVYSPAAGASTTVVKINRAFLTDHPVVPEVQRLSCRRRYCLLGECLFGAHLWAPSMTSPYRGSGCAIVPMAYRTMTDPRCPSGYVVATFSTSTWCKNISRSLAAITTYSYCCSRVSLLRVMQGKSYRGRTPRITRLASI